MGEDMLTRVPVGIVGVTNRLPLLSAFEKEGCYPVGGDVLLVCGKAAVDRVLGSGWCSQITALRKYGDQRAVRRSSWEPYCVRHGDGWVVTCIHPEAVRKSQWKLYPSLRAAVRWSIDLAQGHLPYDGGRALTLPKEWQ